MISFSFFFVSANAYGESRSGRDTVDKGDRIPASESSDISSCVNFGFSARQCKCIQLANSMGDDPVTCFDDSVGNAYGECVAKGGDATSCKCKTGLADPTSEACRARAGATNDLTDEPCETAGQKGFLNRGGTCIVSKSTADSNQTESPANLCQEAYENVTTSACVDNGSWMSAIGDVTSQLGGAVQSASACKTIAATSVGASTSADAFKKMCSSAAADCVSACVATDADTQNKLKECKRKEAAGKQTSARMIAGAAQLAAQVRQCELAFGAVTTTPTDICAANPASCAGPDFSGYVAGKMTGDQAGGSRQGIADSGTGTSSSSSGSGGDGFTTDDLGGSGFSLGEVKPNGAGEDPGGAKGGGGAAGGSGGSSAGTGTGGNGKPKSEGIGNILAGFFGGGGGTSGSGGGGGWRSLFGLGGDKKVAEKQQKGPDLRQFLPGAINDPLKRRGIAGQIVGADGMLGPHANIWKQINNRYQYKRASLIP